MIKYILLTLLFSTSAFAARTEYCPDISPIMIAPIVEAKVTYDKKNQNYIYKYKIHNLKQARVPINRVLLESGSVPVKISAPKFWYDPEFDQEDSEVVFRTIFNKLINPGQSLDGFEVVSKSPPGITRVYLQGFVSINNQPSIKYDTDEEAEDGDDETISCPGWYRSGDIHGDQVTLFTTGPSIANRVEAKIRIKRVKDKKWCGRHDADADIEISPLDVDKIQVMVFGSKDVDVNQIKVATLEFGRGKAKPVSSKIIGEIKNDDDFDDEIKKHRKASQNVQHLLLEFNLQDVDVKCDLDRALFLVGKIGDKDLFAAAKINPVACDKKTFSKEAKKNKGHGGGH